MTKDKKKKKAKGKIKSLNEKFPPLPTINLEAIKNELERRCKVAELDFERRAKGAEAATKRAEARATEAEAARDKALRTVEIWRIRAEFSEKRSAVSFEQ